MGTTPTDTGAHGLAMASEASPSDTGDDAALAHALRHHSAAARAEFFDRYASHVERVLTRVLGMDRELADLAQEVFLRALAAVGSLREDARLRAWLSGIAVHVARECIRRRQRRRWLSFSAPEHVPEQQSNDTPDEIREAHRCVYLVLSQLPADDRIAFALRLIDGMELTEVAEALGVSLATTKRRLQRARIRFDELARQHPALLQWMETP